MRSALVVLAAFAAPHAGAAPIATPPAPFPQPAFRISHDVEPVRYRAQLALGTTSFTGHVELDARLAGDVSLFWLHAVDLRIAHARAIHGDTSVELEVSAQRDQQRGFRAKTPLAAGAWTIAIDYTGAIHELEPPTGPEDRWSFGVFRRDIDGATYLASQSEAIYARTIFPCIDEPDRKVPWQLTLDVAGGNLAASNTPIARTSSANGRTRVEFAETLPLPSYLIAFAVGPFDVVQADRVRVLALRGHAASVAAAAKLASTDLSTFEQWFGVPYVYPKLDLVEVARPGWGAMENPGLVTVDAHVLEGAWASETIAHELAHLWFGDTVTPAWWNDIWLNESFATYFAARIAGGFDGDEWASLGGGGARVIVAAATTEQLAGHDFAPAPAIQHGAGVLAALERWLGGGVFLRAVHAYLAAHVNGTVTTADLVTALGPAVTDVLHAMLDAGWPMIAATLECKRVVTTSTSTVAWPICVAYDRDGKRAEACGTTAAPIALPARACPRWMLANANARGMYALRSSDAARDGWPQLTLAEKIYVFDHQPRYDAHLGFAPKLDLLAKLDGERDPRWLDREAMFLDLVASYVPPDLAAAFAKRVVDRFAASARAATLVDVRGSAAARLVARVGDPATEAHAALLVDHVRELAARGADPTPILALAMRDAPMLADRWFRALDVSGRDAFDYALIVALAEQPSIVDVLERDPAHTKQLPPNILRMLVQDVCDAAARDRIVALVGTTDAATQIDRCIATRSSLDPHFRAWLTH